MPDQITEKLDADKPPNKAAFAGCAPYSCANGSTGRYHCRGGHLNHGGAPCISFGGLRIDRAMATDAIARVPPLGVEAALAAVETCRVEQGEKRRQIELASEQARYEAAFARRQYDTINPDNRLVAAELEQRWNECLSVVDLLIKISAR